MAGKFAGRTDAAHVLAQLPPLGGIEHCAPEIAAAVRAWRPLSGSEQSPGLVLLGPTGCGKSTALRWLILRMLEHVEWATSSAFVLAPSIARNREVIESAKRVRLLVIDDVGADQNGSADSLFEILDHRHTRFPTFISSGLTMPDLMAQFSGATVRRMLEFRGRQVQLVSVFGGKKTPAPKGGFK